MANIFDYINLQNQLEILEDKIQPLIEEKETLSTQMKDVMESLDSDTIKIIANHLWLNMSDEERQNAKKKRKESEELDMNSFDTKYLPFHPFIDKWRIASYLFDKNDKDNDKIKITVVCDREANHISGLMSYYIPHVTDWIDLKEFKK